MKETEKKTEYASLYPEVCIQYENREIYQNDLVEMVKRQYYASGNIDDIKRLQLFIKPEEYKVYFVINDSTYGNIDF